MHYTKITCCWPFFYWQFIIFLSFSLKLFFFFPLSFSASFCLLLHSLHSLSTVWSMMFCLPIEQSTTRDKAKTLWTETKSLCQMLSYQASSAPKGKDAQFKFIPQAFGVSFFYCGWKIYLSHLKLVHLQKVICSCSLISPSMMKCFVLSFSLGLETGLQRGRFNLWDFTKLPSLIHLHKGRIFF